MTAATILSTLFFGEITVAKKPRIVVVGSVNTDMVVKGKRLPGPGETVSGGSFLMAGGGKGANQAVAAARLGAEVTLVAKVGRDMLGDQAIENFGREGIRTDGILRSPDDHTGVALILVDDAAENLISVASGANHALTPEEIEQQADRIAAADMVVLQLETPLDTVFRAAQIAARSGVPVILNPAPAAPLPEELFACVTYLTPNETETELLTGIAVRDADSAREAAEHLLAAGTRHVIVTLGAKGAQMTDANGTVLVPSVRVDAVDTTAAGDTFIGYFLADYTKSGNVSSALQIACKAAAICVTRPGAADSIPYRKEVAK